MQTTSKIPPLGVNNTNIVGGHSSNGGKFRYIFCFLLAIGLPCDVRWMLPCIFGPTIGFFHLLFCDCFVTTSMPRQYFAKFVIDKNKTKNIFQNSLSLCLSLLTFGSLPNQFNTLNLHYIFQTNEYVWDHPTIRKNANDLYPHVIFRRRQPIYMMSELTVNEMDFLIVSLYNVFFILFIIKLTHIPHSTINFMIIFDPIRICEFG